MNIYNRILGRMSRTDRKLLALCIFIISAVSSQTEVPLPKWLVIALNSVVAVLAFLKE